jgi:hypothetical protein
METARQAVVAKLGALPCSAVRVSASDDGNFFTLRVGGIWGDYLAMQRPAVEAATATGAKVEVERWCDRQRALPAVDGLKTAAAELGPPCWERRRRLRTADRATFVSLGPVAGQAGAIPPLAERSGKVRGLADLGNPRSPLQGRQRGLAEDSARAVCG